MSFKTMWTTLSQGTLTHCKWLWPSSHNSQLNLGSALQRSFQAHSSQQHEITLWQIQFAWQRAMSVNLPPSVPNQAAYKPRKLKPAARWNVTSRLCTSSTHSRHHGRLCNRCSDVSCFSLWRNVVFQDTAGGSRNTVEREDSEVRSLKTQVCPTPGLNSCCGTIWPVQFFCFLYSCTIYSLPHCVWYR